MTNNTDPNIIREQQQNPIRQVAVLGIINEAGSILMVRTTRLPNHWQPLGGGMDPLDKTPEDTIIREIGEESSIIILRDRLQHEITTDYDLGNGKVYFYSTKQEVDESTWFDSKEIVEHKWFTLEEALNLTVFPATKRFLTHLVTSRHD